MVGALLAFAGNSFIFEMYNNYSDAVFFQGNGFSPDVLKLKNWLCGIIGATIVGYHHDKSGGASADWLATSDDEEGILLSHFVPIVRRE